MTISLSLGAGARHVIGLMFGTSHNGVSAALVRIDERRRPMVKLLASKTLPSTLRSIPGKSYGFSGLLSKATKE